MSTSIQLLINILIPTALFGLVAAGFSVFYALSRVQHLAIGASVSGAGYAFLYAIKAGFGVPPAVILALAAAVAIGLFCNIAVYERLQGRRVFSALVALVSSIMLLLIAQSLILMLFGSQPKSIPLPALQRRFEIFGASITAVQIIILPLTVFVLSAFTLYLKNSRLGTAVRAAADNPEVAEIIGINTRRLRNYAMTLISLVAGIAGILIAIEFNLEPFASNMHAIKAFGRTIVGGTGSVAGAMLAGLLTETAEQGGGFLLSSSFKEVYSFLVVFLFLLLRPQGLFGQKKE